MDELSMSLFSPVFVLLYLRDSGVLIRSCDI